MIIIYFIISVVLVGLIVLSKSRRTTEAIASIFYFLQAFFAVAVGWQYYDKTDSGFFTFDATGMLFFGIMSIISPIVFWHSKSYLKEESVTEYKIYNALLIALCAAITGVYFANNLAVSWIFLEATTLCTAGLIYHRRSIRSLEATWKYIFVCSTGIAIAYLGVLLLSTTASNGELSYTHLTELVTQGNPLYLKLAFLFILVGYSCKLEIFPFYSIGVDANHATPAPASALISTALVNAGFVSVLRVYKVIAASEILPWAQHVLIATGALSLLFAAFFLRRTNHYKRFLAYSTVENMGIAAIGLGIGGVGVYAAILHLTVHSFVKSGLFLQIAQVGKIYGTYRINRIGNYININRFGAVGMIVGALVLLAFPPSGLFISELMVFKEVIAAGQWWLIVVMVILLCVIIYSVSLRVLMMCYQPTRLKAEKTNGNNILFWSSLGLVLVAVAIGVYQPAFFIELINTIVA